MLRWTVGLLASPELLLRMGYLVCLAAAGAGDRNGVSGSRAAGAALGAADARHWHPARRSARATALG